MKQAGRPSPLREAAYAEPGAALVGPGDDPDGWELKTATLKGRLFDADDVEVYARVSVLLIL